MTYDTCYNVIFYFRRRTRVERPPRRPRRPEAAAKFRRLQHRRLQQHVDGCGSRKMGHHGQGGAEGIRARRCQRTFVLAGTPDQQSIRAAACTFVRRFSASVHVRVAEPGHRLSGCGLHLVGHHSLGPHLRLDQHDPSPKLFAKSFFISR